MYQEIKFSNTVCIKVLGHSLLAVIITPKTTEEAAQGLVKIFNSLRQEPNAPEYLIGMTGLALSWGLDILGATVIPVNLN